MAEPDAGDSAADLESDAALAVGEEEEEKEPEQEIVKRDTWGSTISYILTLIGYAVGFGNIWRFPYQVRENGGAVFLIPYCIMLALVGVPTFFMELAVGQRRRKGIIYAWNEISPAFGGIGISHGWLCFLIGMYYNTLLAYCIAYLYDSFFPTLPWQNCEAVDDKKYQEECNTYLPTKSSKFYWHRATLQATDSIDNWGTYSYKLLIVHSIAWALVWLILWKGTELIGKIVYFTAIFPYVVLIVFFIANCAIEPRKGWTGAYRLLYPNWSYLLKPVTWLKAGSQIFFSLGLGLGCLVVFASYSPARNNCYKDAIRISLINCGTSVFAALVVFPMIGALGYRNYEACVTDMYKIFPDLKVSAPLDKEYDIYFTTKAKQWQDIDRLTPITVRIGWGEMTDESKEKLTEKRKDEKFIKIFSNIRIPPNKASTDLISENIKDCSIGGEATASGGGTGFVFVGFTEAVKHLPCSNFWSVMFFFMLFLLGIDSGFGTVEGAVAAIEDWTGFNRGISSSITCGTLTVLALLLFPFGNGIYILDLVDQYTANWTLLIMALMECIAVAWSYGLAKFSYDVRLMTGKKPNLYILICWKWVTPIMMVLLLLGSIIQFAMDTVNKGGIKYSSFDPPNSEDGTGEVTHPLPGHSLATGFILLVWAMLWVPLHAVLRKTRFRLLKGQGPGDFPEEELRVERNINVVREEDQFTNAEKKIMGRASLQNLQEHRDRKTSRTDIAGQKSRLSTIK